MNPYHTYSDQLLFDLLKEGHVDAYAEIYNRYWAVLYRHALRMLRDETLAEDTIQDMFLNLWDKAPDITIKSSLSIYLYSSVRNRILDHWRHQLVEQKYIDSFDDFIKRGECLTDFLAREKELSQLIEQEVAALPNNMRKAFELSRNSNMSYREIAVELGVSEDVVRNNVSRALKILKRKLGHLAAIALIANSL